MPRVSLPTCLKTLTTYPVVLSSTTEDHLWEHFTNSIEAFEININKYVARINDLVEWIFENNPYQNSKWRNHIPSKKYQTFIDWFGEDEIEMREYTNLRWFSLDFKKCMKVLEWDKDENKKQELNYLIETYDNPFIRIKGMEEEIQHLDIMHYIKTRNIWKEADKVWIAENDKKIAHRSHKSKEYYIKLFAEDEFARNWYKNVIPNNDDTCEYCIKENKEREEYALLEKNKEEERLRDEEEDKERKKRQEEERIKDIQNRPVVIYTCELCDYTSRNKFSFEEHKSTKEHQHNIMMKETYCPACEIQCRTRYEYRNHILSNKHQNKIDSGDTKIFTCEPCGFSTGIKHKFDIHCSTTKHLNTINPKEPSQYLCEPCSYTTYIKQHYDTHCLSGKHIKNNTKAVPPQE